MEYIKIDDGGMNEDKNINHKGRHKSNLYRSSNLISTSALGYVVDKLTLQGLKSLKNDFDNLGGCMNLTEFVEAGLHAFTLVPIGQKHHRYSDDRYTQEIKTDAAETEGAAKAATAAARENTEYQDERNKINNNNDENNAQLTALVSNAALLTEAFKAIDVNDTEIITWHSMCEYLEKHLSTTIADGNASFNPFEHICSLKHKNAQDCIKRIRYSETIDKLICVYQSANTFQLIDPITYKSKHEFISPCGPINDACHLQCLNRIAVAGYNKTIRLLTANGVAVNECLTFSNDTPTCLEEIKNSNNLVSGSLGGRMHIWDVKHLNVKMSRKAHSDYVSSIMHVVEDNFISTASADSIIKIWDIERFECKQTLCGHNRSVLSLAYMPLFGCLISAGLDQDAYLWSPAHLSKPMATLNGHPFSLAGVCVLKDSPHAVTADTAGTLRLWDLRKLRAIQTFGSSSYKSSDITSLCYVSTHEQIVIGGPAFEFYERAKKGNDIKYGKDMHKIFYSNFTNGIVGINNCKIVAMQYNTKDVENDHTMLLQENKTCAFTAACINRSGKRIWTGDENGGIMCLNAATGALLHKTQNHSAAISAIEPIHNTKMFVSGCIDGTTLIHQDMLDSASKVLYQGKMSCPITCIACSCQHKFVVVGGETESWIVNARKFRREGTITCIQSPVTAVAIADSAKCIFIAERAGLISLFKKQKTGCGWIRVYIWENIPFFNDLLVDKHTVGMTLNLNSHILTQNNNNIQVNTTGLSQNNINKNVNQSPNSKTLPMHTKMFSTNECQADEKQADLLIPTYKRNLFQEDEETLILPATVHTLHTLENENSHKVYVYTGDDKGVIRHWDLTAVVYTTQIPTSNSSGLLRNTTNDGNSYESTDTKRGIIFDQVPNGKRSSSRHSSRHNGVVSDKKKTFMTQPNQQQTSPTSGTSKSKSASRKHTSNASATITTGGRELKPQQECKSHVTEEESLLNRKEAYLISEVYLSTGPVSCLTIHQTNVDGETRINDGYGKTTQVKQISNDETDADENADKHSNGRESNKSGSTNLPSSASNASNTNASNIPNCEKSEKEQTIENNKPPHIIQNTDDLPHVEAYSKSKAKQILRILLALTSDKKVIFLDTNLNILDVKCKYLESFLNARVGSARAMEQLSKYVSMRQLAEKLRNRIRVHELNKMESSENDKDHWKFNESYLLESVNPKQNATSPFTNTRGTPFHVDECISKHSIKHLKPRNKPMDLKTQRAAINFEISLQKLIDISENQEHFDTSRGIHESACD